MSQQQDAILDREPTADERAGMNWWNAMDEDERKRWSSPTGVVADAWRRYKEQVLQMPGT